MERYIALLRGVNVGGKNIISMLVLKTVFEEDGFLDVRTYINSGNILVSCDDTEIIVLQQKCKQIIADNFGLDIPVAVISVKDLADALANAPEWWDRDKESKNNMIFVIAPANAEHITKEIGTTKPEYELVAYHGQVIFWTAPIKTFSHTRWSKIASTSVYSWITIRNANTAKKLLQIST